jgi:PAS domain S-box-containing protein
MPTASILYIEDDANERETLVAALVGRGFAVRGAESGEAGLETFERERADLVLCDLNMPGMSGMDVLRRVKALDADVPVVLLTSRGTVSQAVKAIKVGASDFIRKPAEIDEIILSITNALERRQLADSLSRARENVEFEVAHRTEQLESAYQQLFQLNAVSARFARIHDEDEFWEAVPKLLCDALAFDRASIELLVDGRLTLRSHYFTRRMARHEDRFLEIAGEGGHPPRLLTEAFEKNRTIFVPDVANDPRFPGSYEREIDVRALVVSPIRLGERAIGVIVGNLQRDGYEMTQQDVARFEMFAVMVSLALENIRAYRSMEEKVRQRTHELEENAVALAQANVDLLGVQEELEAKNAELQRTEERMMTIMQASPIPLIVTRLDDGTILYANDHLADLIGMSVDALIGRKTPDFYQVPGDREQVLRQLQEDGYVNGREVLIKRAKDDPIWMLFSLVVSDLGGEKVIVGGLFDINQRKEAEAALQESEELFRGIVESANDIIFTMSKDLEISYVSPNVRDLLGYSPSELIRTRAAPYIHPDDAASSEQAFARVLERGEPLANFEHRVLHKDGSVRWFHVNAAVVRNSDGETLFMVAIAHDFTEHKRFVAELERAHRELSQTQSQLIQSEKMASLGMLVAGIAHEINTPIGAVSSMHDTLLRTVDKLREEVFRSELDDERRSRFERFFNVLGDANRVMRSGVERVTTIVRRLRSFARLDEAELKDADINEGIEDTLTLVHHELKHDIDVVKNLGPLPPIPCFPGRLNQVFLNLIVNARQAIKGKGTITIETERDGHEVVIRISDTGVGIARDHLDRVFDPGFTTKGVGVGTGLGLSICYQIVQDHRGTISVDSEPAKGTTFTIRIPDNLDEYYGDDGRLRTTGDHNA